MPSRVPLVFVLRFVRSALYMFVGNYYMQDLVYSSCFIFFGDGILGVNYELSKGVNGLECCPYTYRGWVGG